MKKRLRIVDPIGIYEGDTLNGRKHGNGIFKWTNGDQYEGEFREDNIEGRGVMMFKNGNQFEGDWKSNKIHGKGVYSFKNGDRYEGDFENGKRSGRGTSFYHTGNRFDGEYRFGLKNGNGVFYLKNGDQRTGEWKNGKEDGRMMYIEAKGVISFQMWENGNFVKMLPKEEAEKDSKFGEFSQAGRYAFLVGQNQGELKCCVNDANKMEERLQSFGYECMKITNVKHVEFQSSFDAFVEKVEHDKSDSAKIFFYYSGHGFEDDGSLFLVCFGERSMNFNGILKTLNKLKSKCHVNVVIDACRFSEEETWKAGGSGGKSLQPPNVQQFEKSFILGFSCASGKRSEAGKRESDLSVYTRELLSTMKAGIPFLEIVSGAGSRMKGLNKVVRNLAYDHQTAWVNFTARSETFKSCL